MNKGPYVLVYQVGIANLFDATGREPIRYDAYDHKPQDCGIRRVCQSTYSVCEQMAAGLILAGATVIVCHCDVAGDCMLFDWLPGAGDLWRDKKHPPHGSRDAGMTFVAKSPRSFIPA